MSDFFEEPQGEDSTEEMVTRAFSRCQNGPKERIGIKGLADALTRAADRFGVPAARIVAECAESSQYCPTDADLINVARGLKPAEPEQTSRRCPLGMCDGSGWREVCHLHTHYARLNGPAYVEKEIISREVFDQISDKLHGTNQSVYESRYRCRCHPARQDEIEKRGKYA